jgi:hypothetical protein
MRVCREWATRAPWFTICWRKGYSRFAIGIDQSDSRLSWFSPKENFSSRSLSGHSNCETALEFDQRLLYFDFFGSATRFFERV